MAFLSTSVRHFAIALLSVIGPPSALPQVTVQHVNGFVHGYVVVKDLDDKILASGEITQNPSGERVSIDFILRFKDGSLYEEKSVYSQRRVFQLLRYRQVQRGPSFKYAQTLSFDTSSGTVSAERTDPDGKATTVADHLDLPPGLANGILPTLVANLDPTAETTLSMLVATPKPRVVKLKISSAGQDSFFIGSSLAGATHYVIKIDIGGVTGAVAKVAGKNHRRYISGWRLAGRRNSLNRKGHCTKTDQSGGLNWRARVGPEIYLGSNRGT